MTMRQQVIMPKFERHARATHAKNEIYAKSRAYPKGGKYYRGECRNNGGFSMLEILVSALVMGVGLLGMAGLLTKSIQNNTSAIYRTQAVQVSYEIMDRIRTNPDADYSINMDDDPPNFNDCEGSSANCSPAQMRNYDLAEWKCSLGKYRKESACQNLIANGSLIDLEHTLPEGDGSIDTRMSGSEVFYTITVNWADTRENDENDEPRLVSFVMETKL